MRESRGPQARVAAKVLTVLGLHKNYGDAFAIDGVSFDVDRNEIVSLLVLFLFGIALGILGSAIVLRLGPASEWFIWPIPGLIAPFVGVFYPLSTLPVWMQAVSYLLPPSYVFEGMRAIVSDGTLSGAALLWGGGLAALYVVLACWFFAHSYQHAVRTGLIARYSAETVS